MLAQIDQLRGREGTYLGIRAGGATLKERDGLVVGADHHVRVRSVEFLSREPLQLLHDLAMTGQWRWGELHRLAPGKSAQQFLHPRMVADHLLREALDLRRLGLRRGKLPG